MNEKRSESVSAEEQLSIYEDVVMNTTEDLLCRMDDCAISRAEIARRVGKSRSTISRMLDGDRNMTLRTLVKLAAALGMRPRITFVDIRSGDDRVVSLREDQDAAPREPADGPRTNASASFGNARGTSDIAGGSGSGMNAR